MSMPSASVSADYFSVLLLLCGSAGLSDPAERVRFPRTSAVGAAQLSPGRKTGEKRRAKRIPMRRFIRSKYSFLFVPQLRD